MFTLVCHIRKGRAVKETAHSTSPNSSPTEVTLFGDSSVPMPFCFLPIHWCLCLKYSFPTVCCDCAIASSPVCPLPAHIRNRSDKVMLTRWWPSNPTGCPFHDHQAKPSFSCTTKLWPWQGVLKVGSIFIVLSKPAEWAPVPLRVACPHSTLLCTLYAFLSNETGTPGSEKGLVETHDGVCSGLSWLFRLFT
jgi:hypothetical protein